MTTPVAAWAVLLIATAATAQESIEFEGKPAGGYPIVLTPTRLRQPMTDVPASVTVIRSETLVQYGITSVPEALRLVPGMEVLQASAADYRINFHGSSILAPRRLNVLVDGASVYQPAFARVDWSTLPVVIEDIDRIEVTRGPDSAAYGPASMMAVVNIITKHPTDVGRGYGAVTAGSRGTLIATGRVGFSVGPTTARLTVNHEKNDGYDSVSRGGQDGLSVDRVSLRTQTSFDRDTTLNLDAGYSGGTRRLKVTDTFLASDPDDRIDDYYLSGVITKAISPAHEIQLRANYWSNRVRQTWLSCTPTALLLPEMYAMWQANPAYANAIIAGRIPSGGSPQDDVLATRAIRAIAALGPRARQPTCSAPNQNLNEDRTDLELQDTYVFSDRVRFVGGVGARHLRGESQTYLAGAASDSQWRIFGNLEAKPVDRLTVNAGGYFERSKISGSSFSYRLAANYHVGDTQTIRAAWSTGTRTPDIQEQRADWTYTGMNATPTLNGSSEVRFFESARSPGDLASERVRSAELGYLLSVPTAGLLFDARVFEDRLTDLISEKLQLSGFAPTNGNGVTMRGVELQASLELSSSWSGFAQYAYLDNYDATTVLEQTQYSRHSGALGVSHSFGTGWRASLAYYGASGNGVGQQSFGREDLTLSKRLQLGQNQASIALIVRRLDKPTVSYYRDTGSTLTSTYNDRLQVFGQASISF